jgi:8-oxo-dGTP pyrophosphatase MutT (NUDIX family)
MEHCALINAVGVWFYSIKTNRYLYLLRNDSKNPGCWGLPGGKVDNGENLQEAMTRECTEEIGLWPDTIKLVPIEKFTSIDNKFSYHTFLCLIKQEFTPILNSEHHGYSWIKSGVYPKPLHPGLWTTINFQEILDKIESIKQFQISQNETNSP